MRINVLGVEYEVVYHDKKDDVTLISSNSDGYCDRTIKQIVLKQDQEYDPLNVADGESYDRETLRHELIHAFLFESGLEQMSLDETLVQWLTMQFSKMMLAFIQAGCVK